MTHALSPQTQPWLFGHEAAEETFLQALTTKRLHHAWLISGPKGIGKATLGFRLARFLVGVRPDATYGLLGTDPDDPLARRLAEGTYGDLFVLEAPTDEKTGKRKKDIPVDAVRQLIRTFSQKRTHQGGWRLVFVDPAEGLNIHAANALLKTLEEPPPQTLFLLFSHAPGRVMATLRSRCRSLILNPLSEELTLKALQSLHPDKEEETLKQAAHLAEGSPGRGVELACSEVLSFLDNIHTLFTTLPGLDSARLQALMARLSEKNAERSLQALFYETCLKHTARLAREAALRDHLPKTDRTEEKTHHNPGAASTWLTVHEQIKDLFDDAEALNLDPAQLVQGVFFSARQALIKG